MNGAYSSTSGRTALPEAQGASCRCTCIRRVRVHLRFHHAELVRVINRPSPRDECVMSSVVTLRSRDRADIEAGGRLGPEQIELAGGVPLLASAGEHRAAIDRRCAAARRARRCGVGARRAGLLQPAWSAGGAWCRGVGRGAAQRLPDVAVSPLRTEDRRRPGTARSTTGPSAP